MTEIVKKLSRMSQSGIAIIGVEDVVDVIWPDGAPPFEEQAPTFRAWCIANKAHYYARPKEDFNLSTGVGEAIYLNQQAVVVENMS